MEQVCVINSSQSFQAIIFETLHRCYRHIESVHVTSSRQEFLTKLQHLGLRLFSGQASTWGSKFV